MQIEGYLVKPRGRNKYWRVEIPALGIHTQGKSKSDAYKMAKDAIQTVIDQKGFRVKILAGQGETFGIQANQLKPLVGRILRQKRLERGLTLMDMSKRLKSKSPNAFARYEQGKALPSLEKLAELLQAIDDACDPILKIA